jgi:thiol-disulfide isomerase/thioredoxin
MQLRGFLVLGIGLLVGIALGALILLSGNGSIGTAHRQLPPTIGSPVKDAQLALIDAKSINLSSLQGKPVVLNFWATWCPPCKEEMPLLQRYSELYADKVVIIGVNYGEDQEVVLKFLTAEKIAFPIALDGKGLISDQFFVRSYPTTFFIDQAGVLRAQHLGLLSDSVMQKYLGLIGVP